MLVALADLAYRRPRALLATAFGIAVVAAVFGASTPSRLSSSDDDFQDRSTESFRTFTFQPGNAAIVDETATVGQFQSAK